MWNTLQDALLAHAAMLTTSAMVAIVFLQSMRGGRGRPPPARRTHTSVLTLFGGMLVLTVAVQTEMRRAAIAEGDLGSTEDILEVPPVGQPLSILVQGTPQDGGQAVSGAYTLAVWDGGHPVLTHGGNLYERWDRMGRGRGGRMAVRVDHMEERVDLPAETTGHSLRLKLTQLDRGLNGSIHATVVPAPWSLARVAAFGVLLLVLAAIADGSSARPGNTSIYVSFLVVFALLLSRNITPASTARPVFGAAFLAIVVGIPLGWSLRWLARRLGAGRRPHGEAASV